MRPLLAALVALAVLAPPAGAWTRPRTVAAFDEIESVRMFHGPGDVGAISWDHTGEKWGFAALRRGARPGPARSSRRLASVVPGGAGRWLWLDLHSHRSAESGCGCAIPTSWATSAAGSLHAGPLHRVAAVETELDIPPAIAADREGDALIAWVEAGRRGHDHVLVALRKAGGSFGTPRSVLAGDVSSVEVAIGDHGRFVIGAVGLPRKFPGAELESSRLDVLRGDVTRGVTHRDLLDLGADFLATDASVAPDGSIALAWWTDLGGDPDDTGNLYEATGTAAGPLTVASLATTQATVDDQARPVVLAEPGGRAVAMWHDTALDSPPVMLAETSGGPARIRQLAACGEAGDLARRDDGRVLAAWTSCEGVVRAQSRAPRGRWGRVRALDRGENRNLAASFEPDSGRPVVAWVNSDFDRRAGEDALMVAAGDPSLR
jgi:hypothetical protein